MPDEEPGNSVEQHPVEQRPASEAINPPPPPDSPHTQNAETVPQRDVTTDIHEIEDQIRGAEKWMIGLTAAIVLLTAGIVIVGILQWRAMAGQQSVMQRQLEEMRSGGKDTHALATAAVDQATQLKAGVAETHALAKASQDALAVNRDALISVQRAFVSFGQNLLVEARADDADRQRIVAFDFRPLLENSGTTPTRNLHHRFNFLWIPSELPDGFNFSDGSNIIRDVPFLLSPKVSMAGAIMHIPTSTLLLVRDKGFHLYFYGWAMYQDVFKRTPVHVTMFCTEVANLQGDPSRATATGTIPIRLNYISCMRHNCHDEECDGELGDPRKKYPQLIQPN